MVTDQDYSPSMLQYKIANIIHNYFDVQFNYVSQKKQIGLLNYYRYNHNNSCDDMKCKCHKFDNAISFEDVVNLYLRDQVKKFDNLIFKTKEESEKQLYFMHYLSLINLLGLNTKAFQQSNFLLSLESDYQFSNSATIPGGGFVSVKTNKQQNSLSDQKSVSQQKSKSGGEKTEYGSRVKISNLGIIVKQKMYLVQEQIKQSMSMGFSKQQQLTDNLEHAVKLFLQSEESNKKLRNKVIKMINKKREFFTNMGQINTQISLYDSSKDLLIKMLQLEEKLYALYDQFPSQKMQALNSFYQAEIMNNYFSAYKVATINAISDEKLLKMQTQSNFDIFSSKLDYLIMGFNQQSHKLSVRSTSNQIYNFFGLTQEQFKLIQEIDPLLPNSFSQVHEKLVAQFLQTGISKYFRSINLNFCRYQLFFIKPIDFFYEINFLNLEDLTFACFLQNNETQSSYIFCTVHNRLSGITKNLVTKIGYSSKLNNILVTSLQKVSINKIFPHLLNQIEHNPEKFLDGTQISQNQLQMIVPQQFMLENNLKISWDNPDHLSIFHADCIIHLRNNNFDSNYFIIEIREIKKQLRTETTTPEPIYTQGYITASVQEFESLDAYIIEEDDQMINFPNAIEMYGLEDDTINIENLNQNLANFNIDDLEPIDQIGRKLKMKEKKNEEIVYNQQLYANQSMVSPKDSALRLIDNNITPITNQTSIKFKKNKQQFFSAIEQNDKDQDEDNITSSVVGTKEKKPTGNKIDEDIDEDLQENIRMQMQMNQDNDRVVHIDDGASQISSVHGLKKSKYSKKYDLIERLTSSIKFSKYFRLSIFFFTLGSILFQIFSGIMLYYSSNDLNQFLEELDLIQIKANVIGPINKYIVSQNTLAMYIILISYVPGLTIASQWTKMQYSKNDINYTYIEIKESFTSQLANPYLNPFFQDQYFDLIMGNYPNLTTYQISARESLYLCLEASYNFVNVNYLQVLTLDFTQGFLVFLYGNYQTFTVQLTSLNQEMLQYSINRSYNVKDKWVTLLIPIIICGFCLIELSFIFYKLYLTQYDSFLQLFALVDPVWLQRDIDRYRGIASLLIKDSDTLFKYQFNLENKEQFLMSEDIRKEKIAQNQKNQRQKNKNYLHHLNQKMSFFPSFILLSLYFGICFSFCFMTNWFGRAYFDLYPNTVEFFNVLSDLSIAVSGVFSTRELTYWQKYPLSNVYYFLPDKNATYFIENFFDQIEKITEFLALVQQFDKGKYITSNSYVDEMEKMMQSDVCQFLPSNKIESASSHCDAVYQGVLRRGFQESATFIRDSLLTEYNSTNAFSFIKRQFSTDEQLEAGLILYDVINSLRQKFQQELKSSTDNLIQQIMIVNLIFLIIIGVSLLLVFSYIYRYFKWEFNLMKRIILLLPQQSIFLDDQLDRSIRQLIVKEELI